MVGLAGSERLHRTLLTGPWRISGSRREIWEVILTGGDPLVLSTRRLAEITRRLAEIEHVRVVRFHAQVPVVEPVVSMPISWGR